MEQCSGQLQELERLDSEQSPVLVPNKTWYGPMRGNHDRTRRELRDWLTDELAEWEGGAQRIEGMRQSYYDDIISPFEHAIGQCESEHHDEWPNHGIVSDFLGVFEKNLPNREYVARCRADLEEIRDRGDDVQVEEATGVALEILAEEEDAGADEDLLMEAASDLNLGEEASGCEPAETDRSSPHTSTVQPQRPRRSGRLLSKKRPAPDPEDESGENQIVGVPPPATTDAHNKRLKQVLLRLAGYSYRDFVSQLPSQATFGHDHKNGATAGMPQKSKRHKNAAGKGAVARGAGKNRVLLDAKGKRIRKGEVPEAR